MTVIGRLPFWHYFASYFSLTQNFTLPLLSLSTDRRLTERKRKKGTEEEIKRTRTHHEE